MTVANKVLMAIVGGLALFFSVQVFREAWREVAEDDRSAALVAGLGWMVAVAVAVVASGMVLRRMGLDHRIKSLSLGGMIVLIVGGRLAFDSMPQAGRAQIALALLGLLVGGLILVISAPTVRGAPRSGSAFPPPEPPTRPDTANSKDG